MRIHKSEKEDYKAAILKTGRSFLDFQFEVKPDPLNGGEFQVLTGTITITNLSTKKSKTYKAGNGSRWPSEFSIDLEQGDYD